MPADINTIVGRMLDAGEPIDAITDVINHHKQITSGIPAAPQPTQPTQKVSADEPDTFWGGFAHSLNPFSGGGEALKAGAKGALGFLKGATIDIPSSIGGALSSVGDAISDPSQFASDTLQSVRNAPSAFANAVSQSGSHPEEFGRMMGQVTGQPLVTAGLTKGIPAGTSIAGLGQLPVEIPSAIQASRPYVGGALQKVGSGIANPKFTNLAGKVTGAAVGGHLGGPVGAMVGYGAGSAVGDIAGAAGRGIRNLGTKIAGIGPLSEAELRDLGLLVDDTPNIKITDITDRTPKSSTRIGTSNTIFQEAANAPSETNVGDFGKYEGNSPRLGLNRAMESDPMNIPGTRTSSPDIGTGPFEMPESNIPNTRNSASRGTRNPAPKEPNLPTSQSSNPRGRQGARTNWKDYQGKPSEETLKRVANKGTTAEDIASKNKSFVDEFYGGSQDALNADIDAKNLAFKNKTGPYASPALSDLANRLQNAVPELDSRISGLPPSEVAPKMGPAMGQSRLTGVFMKLQDEARRHNMSIADYIKSIRAGGGEDFTMPSANLPRVR